LVEGFENGRYFLSNFDKPKEDVRRKNLASMDGLVDF